MPHTHHTHIHPHNVTSLNTVLIICITINMLFVITEGIVGIYHNSLSLLSDAGHNLSDTFGLLLSLFAFRIAKRHANQRFTYGYKKSTILVSLTNAIILFTAIGAIIIESLYKLKNPIHISGNAISLTAGIGIIVNGLTAWLLMRHQKNDLNIRGAFLHMAMDTLVSIGVVVAGIIISTTGFFIIDPIISLIIAIIILISTWKLLKESLYLSLDAVPSTVDLSQIQNRLSAITNIESWHHLHVWAVSTTENAATIHIVLKEIAQMEDTKQAVKELFHSLNVKHCTVEFEMSQNDCKERYCC